jgi:hypothetical protein
MFSSGFFSISPLPSSAPALRLVLPRLFSSSSFIPTQQELVREQRRIGGLKKNEFFGENERLATTLKNAKENSRNHIVFLEGPPGAGKTALLSRLHNLGYQILTAPSYIELCKVVADLSETDVLLPLLLILLSSFFFLLLFI